MSNIARRSAPNSPGKSPQVEGDRYTVLLLDENQLDRFLSRQKFKSLGSQLSRTVDVWPRGHRIRSLAVACAVLLLAVTAAAWLRAAGGEPTTVPVAAPVRRVVPGQPVPTGASFSVQVTSFARDNDARAMAARLSKAGLAAFAWRLDGTQRDVLVGPFVSIDEAEAAQRAVAREGYPKARLYLDERLRNTDATATVASVKAHPGLLLVAAPGRLALTFELAHEPAQVSGQRVDVGTFEITTSAIGSAIDAQEWNVPADVQLVRHVSVAADPQGARGLSARLTLAENAVATVRLEHSRVYVDISRNQPDLDGAPAPAAPRVAEAAPSPVPMPASAPARPEARSAAPRVPVAAPPAGPMVQTGPAVAPAPRASSSPASSAPAAGDLAQYRQAVAPVLARFEEIQPFLRSAVATPTPEVLSAIAGTFADLEQSLHSANVPPGAQQAHGLMTSAIQLARGAVAPTFSGDRMTQVREAMAQFQAAKAQLR